MYMKPTFPCGGSLCPIHAPAQAKALASMHIGSGPGVVGLSGMQVKPLLPLRSVRMLPAVSIAMIVASLETLAGAARMALAISCLSLGAFAAFVAGLAVSADRAALAQARARAMRMLVFIKRGASMAVSSRSNDRRGRVARNVLLWVCSVKKRKRLNHGEHGAHGGRCRKGLGKQSTR